MSDPIPTEPPQPPQPPKKRGPYRKKDRLVDVSDLKALMDSTITGTAAMEQIAEAKKTIGLLEHKNLNLLRKLKSDPNSFRDGLERAVAKHGEHPAQSLMDMAHEKDHLGRYILDAKERRLILTEILAYLVPKQKAFEAKEKADYEFNITVKNYNKEAPKVQGQVVDVKPEATDV